MGAASGHPPYHCQAVPPRANKVSPPFGGVSWVLSTDNSDGRPEVVPLAQGPSSWAGAALPSSIPGTSQPQRSPGLPVHPPSGGAPRSLLVDRLRVRTPGPPSRRRAPPRSRGAAVPSARGVPRVECGPNALPDSRCTSSPAGPRGSPTPVSPRGHPGAAPLTQGLFLGPGQGPLLRPRGPTRRARPSALQGPRSVPSPAPRRQEGQQRRSRISRGDLAPAAILFFFPLGPVGPRRQIGACLSPPLTSTGPSGSRDHGESRSGIPRSAKPR
ncbi:hypothetical protein NDU88_010589 [Pleurodeles waltl]|uniref:Basic proline-rich protein-like n=1 Tax=Pleurodeles waltl TaxID=8319 RepID=A0AAV7S1N6_PLEWA|nr:hypothetical protein NDU88_010589 [Pleurodeles waltl]